jgi:hypothetical protein
MEPETQSLKVRNGWHVFATLDVDYIHALGAYEDELWAHCYKSGSNNLIYDVTSGGSLSSPDFTSSVGSSSGYANTYVRSNFNGQLSFATGSAVGGTNLSDTYNGSNWLAGGAGWTSGGSSVGGVVCKLFKGRVYLFKDMDMYYSDIDGVTGTTTNVDVEQLFERKGSVYWCEDLTSPSNNTDEQYLAYGTNTGEVVVYGGDYPDASNWRQVGRFDIAPMAYPNSVLKYRNDVWIFTRAGVVSLRKLFTEGSEGNEALTVSSTIDPYWVQIFQAQWAASTALNYPLRAAYASDYNKLYVVVAEYVDSTGTASGAAKAATVFSYNTITKGWVPSKLRTTQADAVTDLIYFENELYAACGKYVLKYNRTSYKDELLDSVGNYAGYAYATHSAYMNFNSADRFKQIVSMEPIFKTDFGVNTVYMSSAADFERKTSNGSQNPLIDGYNMHPYHSGVQGNYLQWRLTGSTDATSSDGLTLYSMAMAIK